MDDELLRYLEAMELRLGNLIHEQLQLHLKEVLKEQPTVDQIARMLTGAFRAAAEEFDSHDMG
jgi:hypothetical protein